MAVPKHLEEAVTRLEMAAERIDLARAAPLSLESQREWLEALTDFVQALGEIHEFTNESVHEKLHELAGRLRLRETLTPPPPAPGQPVS